MNLAEIVSQFEAGEAGTDAYVELRAQCLPLVEKDSANAAAYFLIANFAPVSYTHLTLPTILLV